MEKIKILALFGKSGAGKDTILKWMVSNIPNVHKIVNCTTRPKRDYEKDGVDYYFLSIPDFTKRIFYGSMLEATSFNDWFYGTSIDGLNKDCLNIGVFNINGLEILLEDKRLEVLPVYVDTRDKVRLLRSLEREDNPNCTEICRRFLADKQDFSNIPFDYITIENDNTSDFSKYLEQPDIADFILGKNE